MSIVYGLMIMYCRILERNLNGLYDYTYTYKSYNYVGCVNFLSTVSILKSDICGLSYCIIFIIKFDYIYDNVKYISLALSFYCRCLYLFKS